MGRDGKASNWNWKEVHEEGFVEESWVWRSERMCQAVEVRKFCLVLCMMAGEGAHLGLRRHLGL